MLVKNSCISEYSEAELKLIRALSPSWIQVLENSFINPPNLWMILAQEIFCANKTGPEVEALRKVCNAIKNCFPYRMTPEFDELCRFDTKNTATCEISYRYYTAEQCEKLRREVNTDLEWGSNGPNGNETLKVRKLSDLETDHLENILITQPHLTPHYRASILFLIRKRYEKEFGDRF